MIWLKKIIILILLVVGFIVSCIHVNKYLPFSFKAYESLPQLNTLNSSLLEKGKQELKKHKLIILGISRDNRKPLANVINHINYTGRQFKDYKIIIFENDSKDGTKIMLKLWSLINDKVTILNEDYGNKKRPSIKFLADSRNKYLDYIDGKFDDFDLAMVVDMDLLNGWDIRGIYDTFGKFNEWQAVCANGVNTAKGNMYDAFAFRSAEFPYTPDTPGYWPDIVDKIRRIYPVNTPLIPVYSCFNGLAFYKREFIKGCKYDSIKSDCEHVLFHECIKKRNHGNMYLNPSMVLRNFILKDFKETQ